MYKKIVQEICKENNIKCTFLSKDWVIMLEKNNKTRFISGYKFDLNSHGIGLIADDKYALYDVLKAKNIPIIEHKIVYPKTNHFDYAIGCNTYEYVKNYFLKNNHHIVIKPNYGSSGMNVFNIIDKNEINSILDKLFMNNDSLSICPFYKIKHEYRVIMLNGKTKLSYIKYLPVVIGDGKKSIRDLLYEFNFEFFKNKLEHEKYNKILKYNEKFEYSWKFNLAQGATAKKIENPLLIDKLTKIAQNVLDVTNLNFASIDIIQTTNDDFFVLEVNSGVVIENYIKLNPTDYTLAKEIYKEAIESLFFD